jgi:phage terminase large subunit GpA-like protein
VSDRLAALRALLAGLDVPPQVTVSEWADACRVLPSTAAEPGPWRTGRTPYLRGIMDALSPGDPAERVVFMKGSQVGGTEVGLNWVGSTVENAPGLGLFVMPTTESARRNVRVRIDPLIEATPSLAARVVKARSRDPGNTATLKSFPGGQWAFVGANSAVGLRSTPARYLFLDEVDGFPLDADGEGDPVALAIQRTVAFRGRRKIFLVSTPTLAGVSRIEKAFLESDQRRYFVPCPHCGALQPLQWSQVRWPPGRRDLADFACEHCGEAITEADKPAMLARGEWRATAAGDGRTVGFHLSALYSPFETWAEIAVEHGLVRNDPPRLQTWVNLKLGEPWEDRAAQGVTAAALMARCEAWPPDGPPGVVVVTAGIDVQQDRLEVEIVGWGRGEESWSLAYLTLHGNPAEPDVWGRLDDALLRRHAGRPVLAACVDTGAFSKAVYDFASPRHGRAAARVWAIKGSSIRGLPLWPRRPSRPKPGRPPLYVIGADSGKEIAFARLAIAEPGPGFCHWPTGRDLDFFEMMTAERPVRRYSRGMARREWVKASHSRNEAFDARVYALAALHGLRACGLDLDREAGRTKGRPSLCRDNAGQVPSPGPVRPRVIRSDYLERL